MTCSVHPFSITAGDHIRGPKQLSGCARAGRLRRAGFCGSARSGRVTAGLSIRALARGSKNGAQIAVRVILYALLLPFDRMARFSEPVDAEFNAKPTLAKTHLLRVVFHSRLNALHRA